MAKYPEESHVVGGIDTRKDLHVAAVVDHRDRVRCTQSFPTTRHGYRLMLAWTRSFGDLQRIGIECSGNHGAGLLRYTQGAGVEVLEVTAPDRHDRRRLGKNDGFDAESAAHAAYSKRCTVTPRSRDGMVESLRALKVCRKTAVQARRIALQMIQTTIVCAPDRLRDPLRKMTRMQLIRTLAAWRPDLTASREVEEAHPYLAEITGAALSGAARRDCRSGRHDRCYCQRPRARVARLNGDRLEQRGTIVADGRRQSRAAQIRNQLCGIPRRQPGACLFRKTMRHRLNRGGDRAANSAIHIIAIGRLRLDPRPQEYVPKRIAVGNSKPEAIRSLKRYIAREVFGIIMRRHKQINQAKIAA